ncbi:anti-sigma factor, partial [Granulicella sp. S190]|uniref:anti-sigma factor n=1 Tax=Granulicella sp. S190 TaxID=1747226 RepID=UPI00352A5D2D
MNCESAKDCIVLLNYGELPDELAGGLEQHLMECEGCQAELEAVRLFEERLALLPVLEPSPNLLAQSRMRLDDELDMIPPHGFLTRLRTNFFRWLGHVQSAPALATLLLGVGFLAGNFTLRYELAHSLKEKPPVIVTGSDGGIEKGVIANVTGITQTPNSELVQVSYNRVIPETMEGSLDSPVIRNLLMVGTN